MKNQTRLWYLYDFANSFASVVIIFYFPLLFVEKGGLDLWVGIGASISTILLILFLPMIGHWADRTGRRILLITISSIGMSVFLVILAFLFSSDSLDKSLILISSILVYTLFLKELLRFLGPSCGQSLSFYCLDLDPI